MFAALFSVLLLASDSAVAAAPEPEAPVANAPTEAPKPEKICKRQPVTGQLQGTKRVCMTAEQWKRAQEATQRRR